MQTLDQPRRRLAMSLAALAGFVDAAGYLSADRYFVSFMSGNTTRLGVELARQPRAALLPALLALTFVCGVMVGAILTGRFAGRHKPPLLLLVSVLLGCGAWLGGGGYPRAALIALAAAMGALNNSFQRDGRVAVGLTYMTGALVRLGQGLAVKLQNRAAEPWADWLMLWLALAGGATLGALTYVTWAALTFWIAAALAAVLAVASMAIPERAN